MENWQLENACFDAGMCTEGIDETLIRLEEALEDGEINLTEAEQIHQDLFNIKEYRMKPSNLLNDVLRDKNQTEFEKKLMYKAIINTFTSAVATNLIIAINGRRRQDTSNFDGEGVELLPNASTGAGSISPRNGEKTLDQRNVEDISTLGDEYSARMTEDAGHETPVRPERIAEICDGIRFTLYEEMFSFANVEKPSALYKHVYKDPPNYDQPMGLDFNLKFRIQNAGRIDETRAERVAKEDKQDIEFIRDVMRQDSLRNANRLREIAPEVVREAESFHSAASKYTREAFTELPIDMQIRLAGAIASKLDNEYRRLYGVRIRSGSLAVQDQMNVIKENRAVVMSWVEDATKIMNVQSQTTRN